MCAQLLVVGDKDGDHRTFVRNDKNNQFLIYEYSNNSGTSYTQIIDLLKYLNVSYTIEFQS